MKLSEKLREEFNEKQDGVRATHYFRYLGYKEDLTAPIAILRAKGIHALFSKPQPHIFVNDLIVGNIRGLYCTVPSVVLDHASKLYKSIGRRHFLQCFDHYSPNYDHVVQVGLKGLQTEIEDSLASHAGEEEKCQTLEAMKITLAGFEEMIRNYMLRAKELKDHPSYDNKRLEFIVGNCEALLQGSPKTFAQALQLVWFCHTAFLYEGRFAMALGRLDQYLYPFYKKDLEDGILTREEAIELLENTFTKIDTSDVVNICIGGMDPDGNCQVNELSYCIVWAVKNCNAPGPNLSARITPNTPDEFLLECLKSIGTGLGYPALMNDTVNVEALKRYGYETDDVYNYSMVGCIENFITGMQPPWSDGRFDTPRFFDYVFNNGISEYNHSIGLDLGDVEDITSMQEFMEKFEKQLTYGVDEYCLKFQNKSQSIQPQYYSEPFLSCFCYDCIGRGLDMHDGGSKYPSVHGAALMGIGTVCDSLAAIEKVVFVDKAASLTDIKDALNKNFEGYEALRQKLIEAPKYGNNDDFADKYAVWFLDYLSGEFERHRTHDGGRVYVAMAANTQNISAGSETAATPDGRKQGEPLSDAASPCYGKDVRGATATLNSVSKPDYTKSVSGTVINQKFSPSMFEDGKIEKLLALVKTYMKKGGQELQINATSREVLLDAMEHPEKYQNLVVRVSGFSDYYVRLNREVQMDILNRTQQR